MPELKFYARVLFLIIPINSFGRIQDVVLQKELDFKKTSIANTISAIVSGLIGILMAFIGYGVWSLVGQQLSLHLLRTSLYIFQRKWKPILMVSKNSIVELFSFSLGLLIHSIFNVTMRNIHALVIGRFFPVAQVGFYTQANKFQEVSASTLAQSVIKVSFPALVLRKDEPEKLKLIYAKILVITIFLVSPLMFFLIVTGEEIFRLLLTDKWLPAVPYFQILCIYGMFLPVLQISYNIYKLFRKSRLLLIIDLIRHSMVLISIYSSINYGIEIMLALLVACTFIMVLVNLYISGDLISFSFLDQIKAYFAYYIISAILSIGVYSIPNSSFDSLTIFYKSLIFMIGYLTFCRVFKLQGYVEFLKILKMKFKN
jgi:O-antigen/teichoic acid export membrane protein